MCLSSPSIPPVAAAPQAQEVKQPEQVANSKKKSQGNGLVGGTLLTSPAGITGSALNTGMPTILGG